jgi:hypothetical protein
MMWIGALLAYNQRAEEQRAKLAAARAEFFRLKRQQARLKVWRLLGYLK